jgi:hypothetical protein
MPFIIVGYKVNSFYRFEVKINSTRVSCMKQAEKEPPFVRLCADFCARFGPAYPPVSTLPPKGGQKLTAGIWAGREPDAFPVGPFTASHAIPRQLPQAKETLLPPTCDSFLCRQAKVVSTQTCECARDLAYLEDGFRNLHLPQGNS